MNQYTPSMRLRSMLPISTALILIMVVATPVLAQTTWYVDDNAVNDPLPGDPAISDPGEDGSLDHPFDAIQEAIDASMNGDVVLLADGTYTGIGNKNISYHGKAITVRSETGNPSVCVINCESTDRGFSFSDDETADSILDGVTVSNGDSGEGGGLSCETRCSPTIQNCIFTNNQSEQSGGALYCSRWSHPTIRNCIFSQNTGGGSGGAIACHFDSNPTFTNCLIVENSASGFGGGVFCFRDSDPTFSNCTIANNSSGNGTGAAMCSSYSSHMTITNCIVWDHSPSVLGIYNTGSFTVTYSDIEGGYSGTGNIDADPLFISTGDYRLQDDSPCIDRGTNTPAGGLAERDLDGGIRVVDGDGDGSPVVDMGAYEYLSGDCNMNGNPDDQDIVDGTSDDCDGNGIPDECEPECNDNARPDECDIADGTSADCNTNGIPDECEPGCNDNAQPDECDIADGTSADCNTNGIPDECDVASGESTDYNTNGIPDECEIGSSAWLFENDTTIVADNLLYEYSALIVDGCTLLIESTHTFESLTLINGAVVSAPDGSQRVDLTITGDVSIDSMSSIQAPLVLGSAGSGSQSSLYTPAGEEMHCDSWNRWGSGGGHGGTGGDSNDGGATGGRTHGNALAPTSVGGRGGYSLPFCDSTPFWDWCSRGGYGGGAIRLDVEGSFLVNGSISADGETGSNRDRICTGSYGNEFISGGGGAGGSVYLTVGSLSGSGQISANGGEGSLWNAEGGGGRIAIYYETDMLLPTSHITIDGYENGTIHVSSSTNGDFDEDGDVDLFDYLFFQDCFGGPNMAPAPVLSPAVSECLSKFDFDSDDDIDLIDFARFQTKLP